MQQRHGGVVAVGKVCDILTLYAHDAGEHGADSHAVAHNGDCLAVVGLGYLGYDAHKALCALVKGFRPLAAPLLGVVIEIVHLHGVVLAHIAEAHALAHAEADLPQARRGVHFQIVIAGYRRGGRAGAAQVA